MMGGASPIEDSVAATNANGDIAATANAAANSLTGGSSITGNSLLGGSSYSSPYGGGMYGGMGGMYGGGGMFGRPYGMGMGGYGMGGMYGGMYGMNGQQGSFLERMSMYVYQLCEIAQMVEYNANGLYAFYNLMKNLGVATVKFG